VTGISPSELPRILEVTLAGAAVTAKDIEELCGKVREQKLHGVCVASSRVELAASLLHETELKVTALIGGPLGTIDEDAKRYETELAIDYGAQEIEVVLNIGRLKDGDRKYVLRELRDIAEAADERIVKVDLKPHLLTREEILLAYELILDSGAHFICFNGSPKLDCVKQCREAIGPKFGIKAAEVSLDTAAALAFIEAGATRLGLFGGVFPSFA
jgi:deoxyribose-phosphate aldolase